MIIPKCTKGKYHKWRVMYDRRQLPDYEYRNVCIKCRVENWNKQDILVLKRREWRRVTNKLLNDKVVK